MRTLIYFVVYCLAATWCSSQELIKVATYNIKFLDTEVNPDRLVNIKQVIEELDADIIGLQEIDDRLALEMVFSPADWQIIIDDDNGDKQDLALVVRNGISVLGFSGNELDADEEHFLFPNSDDNRAFPRKRDALAVEVEVPPNNVRVTIVVIHAKSRFQRGGGRASTNDRRVLASRMLIQKFEQDFDERNYILLGDFNDSPDDELLSILETGNPNAPAAMEDQPGEFLINLTESLYAEGNVSFSRNTRDLVDGGSRINTIDADSRVRNFENLQQNINTGDNLFDQILIPPRKLSSYVAGSFEVFDLRSAVVCNSKTRASDHLPVSAEFVFETNGEEMTI